MPPDADRLALAVVDVLSKALAPILERLALLEQITAQTVTVGEVARLREAFAAADRDLLNQLQTMRDEVAILREDLERRRRRRQQTAEAPVGDPPADRLSLADPPPGEVH